MVGSAAGSKPSTGRPGSTGEVLVEGLDPNANKYSIVASGSGGGYQLNDPFGQPWFYRVNVEGDPGSSTNNSTFDLWSVATDHTMTKQAQWIKNW